jgi:hypothetical protein
VFTLVLALVLVFTLVFELVAVDVDVLVLLFVFVAVLVDVLVLVLVFVLVLFVVVLLVVSNEFCSQNSVPAVQSGFSGSFSAARKETEARSPTNIHIAVKSNHFAFISIHPIFCS